MSLLRNLVPPALIAEEVEPTLETDTEPCMIVAPSDVEKILGKAVPNISIKILHPIRYLIQAAAAVKMGAGYLLCRNTEVMASWVKKLDGEAINDSYVIRSGWIPVLLKYASQLASCDKSIISFVKIAKKSYRTVGGGAAASVPTGICHTPVSSAIKRDTACLMGFCLRI